MAKVGRPLKFETAEEMAKMANDYFQNIPEGEPLTITGLALHLGFESRQSFYDYEERGEFSYTIKRARMRVENAYEKNLHSQNSTGSIFALKNFGWVDKTNLDHTTNGKDIAPPIKWIDGTDK